MDDTLLLPSSLEPCDEESSEYRDLTILSNLSLFAADMVGIGIVADDDIDVIDDEREDDF